jgi:hypothetical protein
LWGSSGSGITLLMNRDSVRVYLNVKNFSEPTAPKSIIRPSTADGSRISR